MRIAAIHMGDDLFRKYMMSKYTKAIEKAGGNISWITSSENLIAFDGLLLPGGADVNPELYGEKITEECGKLNTFRDSLELDVISRWLETEKPLLAICRGVQILNVALKGTLYQDIKELQREKHSDILRKNKGSHGIAIEKGSLLHSIIKRDELWVNSLHHQAIKDIGEELVASAYSTDGFVEAIEMRDHPFLLGVQWHPEHMVKDQDQRKIFEAFVKAASR